MQREGQQLRLIAPGRAITRQGFAEQIRTGSKQQRLGYSTFRRWWEDPTEVNAATRQAIESYIAAVSLTLPK